MNDEAVKTEAPTEAKVKTHCENSEQLRAFIASAPAELTDQQWVKEAQASLEECGALLDRAIQALKLARVVLAYKEAELEETQSLNEPLVKLVAEATEIIQEVSPAHPFLDKIKTS